MVTILLYIPGTDIEKIFAIFAIVFMAGMFGYALSTISAILTEMNKKENIFRVNL